MDNLHILHNTKNDEDKPKVNKRLYKKINGKYMVDDFKHEFMLALKENNDWVLLTGCSHSGILNILQNIISRR